MMTLLSYKLNHKQYDKILTVTILSYLTAIDRRRLDVSTSLEGEGSFLRLAQVD
jgi:hypothetical protein